MAWWSRSSRSSARARSRSNGFGEWRAYVPVDARRKSAAREVAALAKRGIAVRPVVIEGRGIAATFWGKAWCDHIEAYSDFANRLPRGRTYVRNGSVVDLRVEGGTVSALVQGSSMYRVSIGITKVEPERWKRIVAACAGRVGSVLELLQGKLSESVMAVVTNRDAGLFPSPAQIDMKCSCPDWATLCKHVAATLYGVGARLDDEPELLFALRGVDARELVASAAKGELAGVPAPKSGRRLVPTSSLAGVFGIEMADAPAPAAGGAIAPGKPAAKATARRTAAGGAALSAPAPIHEERTAEELDGLGVPPETVDYWVRIGALERADRPGVFRETASSGRWLGQYALSALRAAKQPGRAREKTSAAPPQPKRRTRG